MKHPSKPAPPKIAHRLLQWICPSALYEGIEGDLLEEFERDAACDVAQAKRRFVINVVRFFRPGIFLRNKIHMRFINTIMLGNYFKVAARNIAKRKLYSLINAFGLSIGIAFCLLIYLFIRDEQSFDQFHANKDRIYRIEEYSYNYWNKDVPENERYNRSAYIQVPLMQVLKDELPEVERASRFNDASAIVKYTDKVFTEEIHYVDGDFFSMFSFRLIAGNASTLLRNKTDVVITPEIATKYFGTEDPIGKTLLLSDAGEHAFTVAGLIEATPANSSFDFKILISQENRPGYEKSMTRWGNFNTPTFVQLAPNANLVNFRRNLDKITDKYMGKELKEWRKEGNVAPDIKMFEYLYTAMPDWHLNSAVEWHKVSDRKYSYILGGIAVLILLIACINYVSLALTTSAARRTEVGIRKVVGAQKNQLVYQFGFEAVLLALASMLAGFGLMALFLPSFNSFTTKNIVLTSGQLLPLVSVGVGLAVFVGIIAGCYPALFLSAFRPALVLKGNFATRIHAGFTRPLVVLQFALSAFLIISSVIMYRQMHFITTKNLGFNQSQVLVVPTQTGWGDAGNRVVEQFRTRLQQEAGIVSVAGTNISFNRGWSLYGYKIKGENRSAYVYSVDVNYISTLNMQLVAGRDFDLKIPSDSTAVIVNEALVRDMGWTDPLNEYLNYREDSVGQGAKVIGVVKDYHYRSLEAPIEPLFLCMDYKHSGALSTMMIRIAANDIPATLDKISAAWKEMYPDKPYSYTFLDEDVANQYKSHQRWMSIMGLSTGFAILISCLGLFGLSGINAVNRTKEIGIRKVMGAELSNIFVLLNRQYVWLSFIAFALAIPFSWFVMDKWLADFKFKIEMGWELFAVSVAGGLVVALTTVSYHAIKAALTNPAETLKYE